MGFFSKIKNKLDKALVPKEVRNVVQGIGGKVLGIKPGGGGPSPFEQMYMDLLAQQQAQARANPFQQALSQIPQGFFQDPRGLAAIQGLMAQYASGAPNSPVQPTMGGPVGMPMVGPNIAPQRPVGGNPFLQAGVPAGFVGGGSASIPGPAPTQATQMGRVGGFGNGGGKMTIPGARQINVNGRQFFAK